MTKEQVEAVRSYLLDLECPISEADANAVCDLALKALPNGATHIKDGDIVELLAYWRTFAPASNEVAAVGIIEQLQRELTEERAKTAIISHMESDDSLIDLRGATLEALLKSFQYKS